MRRPGLPPGDLHPRKYSVCEPFCCPLCYLLKKHNLMTAQFIFLFLLSVTIKTDSIYCELFFWIFILNCFGHLLAHLTASPPSCSTAIRTTPLWLSLHSCLRKILALPCESLVIILDKPLISIVPLLFTVMLPHLYFSSPEFLHWKMPSVVFSSPSMTGPSLMDTLQYSINSVVSPVSDCLVLVCFGSQHAGHHSLSVAQTISVHNVNRGERC